MKEDTILRIESIMNNEILSAENNYTRVERENRNILGLKNQINILEMTDKNIPDLMTDILRLKDNKDTHGLNKSILGPNKDTLSLKKSTLSLNSGTPDMTNTWNSRSMLITRVATSLLDVGMSLPLVPISLCFHGSGMPTGRKIMVILDLLMAQII